MNLSHHLASEHILSCFKSIWSSDYIHVVAATHFDLSEPHWKALQWECVWAGRSSSTEPLLWSPSLSQQLNWNENKSNCWIMWATVTLSIVCYWMNEMVKREWEGKVSNLINQCIVSFEWITMNLLTSLAAHHFPFAELTGMKTISKMENCHFTHYFRTPFRPPDEYIAHS